MLHTLAELRPGAGMIFEEVTRRLTRPAHDVEHALLQQVGAVEETPVQNGRSKCEIMEDKSVTLIIGP
eukprot:692138-Amphidinium_carterae.1